MSLLELFFLAVGLSMDAFAISVCKGLAMQTITPGKALTAGAWFGGFQTLMPLLGWLLGTRFSQYVTSIDHWVVFVLLSAIGLNMIREAFSKNEDADASTGGSMTIGVMLVLALATSVDALAVGITFAFLDVSILPAVCLIGITTFAISAAGVKIGNVFGVKYKSKAELAGGVILVLLGTHILLEHLGLLPR